MKKTLTTVLLLASATFTFGQSIHILYDKADVTGKSITIPVHKDFEFINELSLFNTTSNKVDYQVNRTILTPPLDPCSEILFCTGELCYGPSTDITWTPGDAGSSINANETLPNGTKPYGISAHYNICDAGCFDLNVLYRVFKTTAGSKDTATVIIKYSCSTGITEENAALGSLSDAYPNPANSNFSVKYSLPVFSKSEIAVYDIFGKKLIETQLPKTEGTITLNTSSLTPGVYFYTLVVGNQRAVTKRLVISE